MDNRNDFQFAVITEAGIGENLTENGGSDLLLFIGGQLGVVLFVVPVPAEMEFINRRVRHAGGHIGYLEAVFQGGVFCIHMDIIRHRGWDRFPGEGKLQQGQGIDEGCFSRTILSIQPQNACGIGLAWIGKG